MSSKTATGKPTSGSGFHIKLSRKLNKTILSCGGQFKNTFSVAKGDTLFVSPTFGDSGISVGQALIAGARG